MNFWTDSDKNYDILNHYEEHFTSISYRGIYSNE